MIDKQALDNAARKYAGRITDARHTIAIERWDARFHGFKAGVEWAFGTTKTPSAGLRERLSRTAKGLFLAGILMPGGFASYFCFALQR